MTTASLTFTTRVLLLAASLAPLVACNTQGFQCGEPLVSDPDQTYTCARPEEVCICATRSCARKEYPTADETAHPSKANEPEVPCRSGLRYVPEAAFVADPALAAQCVDVAHTGTQIAQPDQQSRCSDDDGGSSAGNSTSSETGDSSSTTGATSTSSSTGTSTSSETGDSSSSTGATSTSSSTTSTSTDSGTGTTN